MQARVIFALLGCGLAAGGPTSCYTGCTDNGGIPTGEILDQHCQEVTCEATDTHCYSVFSTALVHYDTINPVTGAMDTTRAATDDTDGRNYALGCVDATKQATLKAHYDLIFTGGLTESLCTDALCNKCQISNAAEIATQKKCNYGSFANDYKLCDVVYCPNANSKCMTIDFNGQWGGVWGSGMGCFKDDAASTAKCTEWGTHADFVADSCATCDPAVDGDLCNTCTSSAIQTSPSMLAVGVGALLAGAASLMTTSF